MTDSLSAANRFLGVILFEAQGPSEEPWHTEQTVIVKAKDEDEARVKIRAWCDEQCVPQTMPNGGEWRTRVIGKTAIFPMLFDISENEVTTLRVRQVQDLESLRRADHRIDAQLFSAMSDDPSVHAREIAETMSEGLNFTGFVRSIPVGKRIGQQRAHLVMTLDEFVRVLVKLGDNPRVPADAMPAVRELRAIVGKSDGDVVTDATHAACDRILACFTPKS